MCTRGRRQLGIGVSGLAFALVTDIVHLVDTGSLDDRVVILHIMIGAVRETRYASPRQRLVERGCDGRLQCRIIAGGLCKTLGGINYAPYIGEPCKAAAWPQDGG